MIEKRSMSQALKEAGHDIGNYAGIERVCSYCFGKNIPLALFVDPACSGANVRPFEKIIFLFGDVVPFGRLPKDIYALYSGSFRRSTFDIFIEILNSEYMPVGMIFLDRVIQHADH